ncbi:MAG: tetratricopeptide repeat protein [Gammaproteobacteria bacterium]|nr:tetratricopeptide repeat protein [Gammaproteobacteria bacterium]
MDDEYLTEDEQWDQLKRWVRQNGLWIVGGVALGVLGLWGWRAWEARAERLAVAAGARYEQAIEALARGDRRRALDLVGELERDHASSPYTLQAELAVARALVAANELEQAAPRLRRVMTDAEDPELALVARLRLARVQIAQNRPDDALATLKGAEPGAFAPAFAEVRGDAAYAKGERDRALADYRQARAAAADGIVDPAVLDLKINDLAPANAVAGEAAAAAIVK